MIENNEIINAVKINRSVYGKELLPLIQAKSKTERFSANLMKWVNKYKDKPLFIAIATEGVRSFNPAKTQTPYLYVGYHSLDDNYLMGSRLSEILCNGASTSTWAFHGLKFVEVDDWWSGYIAGGKCFIDPEHTLYYDRERWEVSEDGKTRCCLWCRNHEQYEHVEMVPQKSWRQMPHESISI